MVANRKGKKGAAVKRPTSAAADLAALLRNSPDVGIADISGLNVTPAVDAGAPTLAAQRIELPLPPSANRYWRYTSTGVYVTEEAQNYKAGVMLRARCTNMRPYAGNVAVYVHVYRQQQRGDLDNYAKVLCDSLNGAAYNDDSQVVELHMFRHDDKRNPRVEVEIREVRG